MCPVVKVFVIFTIPFKEQIFRSRESFFTLIKSGPRKLPILTQNNFHNLSELNQYLDCFALLLILTSGSFFFLIMQELDLFFIEYDD